MRLGVKRENNLLLAAAEGRNEIICFVVTVTASVKPMYYVIHPEINAQFFKCAVH